MICFYIESYGCSTNLSESEVMAGVLEQYEFKQVENAEDAYLLIVNVCTVKGDYGAIKHVKVLHEQFPHKKIVVSGCLTKEVVKEVKQICGDASFISTHNIKEIVSVVEETINDNPVEVLTYNADVKINLPRVRKNKIISIIPILSGCNGSCSYCSVHKVKGKLVSYPIEDIVSEARRAIIKGCKEIWITSQDNACYGLDNNENKLVELLNQILKIVGNFRVRLGMMNPNNVLPIMDDLIKVYTHEKMFKFLHLPLQSGDDGILKKMKRDYMTGEFKKVIENFRDKIPEITIATDIIIGFPSESRNQFSNTVDLIKWINPDVLHISRFRARENTLAKKMDEQIESAEAKNRSALITSIFHNIAYMRNERWYNWKGTVIVDEQGINGTWVARNYAYKPIVLEGNYELGQKVDIKISKITKFDLRA